MGKDLKGKELGTGISQRKDGRYSVRYSISGKRKEAYFDNLADAKKYKIDVDYDIEHQNIKAGSNMTLNTWYDFWIDHIHKSEIRTSSYNNYNMNYNHAVRNSEIGNMIIADIKPYHVRALIDDYAQNHKRATTTKLKVLIGTIFQAAYDNDVIDKTPMRGIKYKDNSKPKVCFLTLQEQRLFLDNVDISWFGDLFVFALNTGMRSGEIRALQWNDVDFVNGIIHVNRNVSRDSVGGKWDFTDPKTESGKRIVPMTNKVREILNKQRLRKLQSIYNLVFPSPSGGVISTPTLDKNMARICDKAGIKRISMHVLRHTFATRCIESGMQPKTLQSILGHSKISMTMDKYVHVTDDSKNVEMLLAENRLA